MNRNDHELVKALRACGGGKSTCEECLFYDVRDASECRFVAIREAANLIESLSAQLSEARKALKVVNLVPPTCVCDLCENGTKNRQCYVGGLERCVGNGVYTMFSLRYVKPVSEVHDDPNH